MPTLISERDFARTYDGSAYDDAWQAVKQYRQVRQYQADHPDKGYTATARALELPLGRVRSWLDGRIPYVVAGLNTAHDHGWIGVTYDDAAFEPLNTLVASVYASGSVSAANWSPQFVLNEQGYGSPVVDALEQIGLGTIEREPPTENRAPAIRPERDGAILGRALYVLGVPIGKKADLEDFSLPWYLEDAPRAVRERFVRVYVAGRGYEDRTSDSIQIGEHRPESYRRELAALLESVAGAPVAPGETFVTISADAARNLELAPRYAGE